MIGMYSAFMLSEVHGNVRTGYAHKVYELASKAGYHFKHVLDCSFEQLASIYVKR